MLDNLKNLFETKNIIRTSFLLSKLHILHMGEGTLIVEFLCNIKDTTTYLISITFSRTNNGKIPKELYIGEHPNVNHI